MNFKRSLVSFALLLSVLCLPQISKAQSFNTTFPATENPISQGGQWINGGAAGSNCGGFTGQCFGNVQTVGGSPGHANGTNTSPGCTGNPGSDCNDSTAILTGTWASNQSSCIVVQIDPSLNRNNSFYEVENRINVTISAGSINGYEANYSVHTNNGTIYAGIVRWNGAIGDFTGLTDNTNPPILNNGDIMCLTRNGGTLTHTVSHNGVVTTLSTATDSTFLGGSPGIGFFNFNGPLSDNLLFGASSFTATGGGTGGGSLTVSPAAENFGSTSVGSTSASQTATVTNSTGATVTFSSATYSSTGTATGTNFLTTSGSTCGSTLANGATCTIPTAFKPSVSGSLTDTLNIAYVGKSPLTVSLTGTGGTVSGSSCANTTTCTAVTCNSSDVQNSLNTINTDGTILTIPRGTCTWGNLSTGACAVSYSGNNSYTLQGSANIVFTGVPGQAGYTFTDDGGTTIIDHVNHNANDQPALCLSVVAGKTMRLTGVSFIQDAQSIQSFNGAWLSVAGSVGANIRVDHVHFNISQNNSLAFQTNGTYSGVMDHIVGEGIQGSGWRDHTTCNGDADWTVPGNFGTNTSGWRYYESSIFHNFSNDGVCGGRMAYRFNTQFMTGTGPSPTEPLQTHATSSGGDERGQRAFEVYGNHFNCPTYLCDTGMEITGGTGLVFGNIEVPATQASCTTAPCGWHSFMRVAINRFLNDPTWYDYAAPPAGWGFCTTNANGVASGWDDNVNTRCIDAPGNGAGDLLSGNFPNKCNITLNPACNIFTGQFPRQAKEPVYEWMDAWTSSGAGGSAFWGGFSIVTIQNRDVYLDCSPTGSSGCTSFNGTVGVGHGASLPTSAGAYTNAPNCTIGVAYWYTAGGNWNQSGNGFGQGQLYKCTATNTWTLYYTPLTYPHPLVGGGQQVLPPAPPTNLQGVVN